MNQDTAPSSVALDGPVAYEAPSIKELGTLADLTLGGSGDNLDLVGGDSIGPS